MVWDRLLSARMMPYKVLHHGASSTTRKVKDNVRPTARHREDEFSTGRHHMDKVSTTKHSKAKQRAATAPAATNRISVTPISSTHSLSSPDMENTSGPADSILSGELGDSECSTLAEDSHTHLPAAKKRAARSPKGATREKEGRKGSGKFKRTASGKRNIKMSPPRADKQGDTGQLPGSDAWTLDRTFDVSIRRSPLIRASTSSIETEERPTSDGQGERVSSDSEEYDTDPEERFPTPPLSSLDTTGRTSYIKTCRKFNVAPCSIFLRQAMDENLHLQYYGLGPRDVQALAIGFRDNTFISSVNLSFNYPGTEGVMCITRALRENQHISHLDLSFCFLGRESTGAMAIFAMIKASNHIHSLNISRSPYVGDQTPSRLYVLDISDNEFGPGGIAPFVDALAENDILEELDMAWNPLLAQGVNAMFHSVSKNMKLKNLNMFHTGVNDTTCQHLVRLLMKNDFLQALDLRQNCLTPAGARIILIAMDKSKSNIDLQL